MATIQWFILMVLINGVDGHLPDPDTPEATVLVILFFAALVFDFRKLLSKNP